MAGQASTLREVLQVLWTWIKGRAIIWLSVTALYLFGFGVARAPLWWLLALLCGLLEAIPHFGAIVSLFLVLVFTAIGSENNAVVLEGLAVWVWCRRWRILSSARACWGVSWG